jgi:hypothetical protein
MGGCLISALIDTLFVYNFYMKYCQKTIYAHSISPPLMLGTVLDSCKILGRSMHNFFVLKKKFISVVDCG